MIRQRNFCEGYHTSCRIMHIGLHNPFSCYARNISLSGDGWLCPTNSCDFLNNANYTLACKYTEVGFLSKVSMGRAKNAWQRPQRQHAGHQSTVWQCRKFSRAGLGLSCNIDIFTHSLQWRTVTYITLKGSHRHRPTV